MGYCDLHPAKGADLLVQRMQTLKSDASGTGTIDPSVLVTAHNGKNKVSIPPNPGGGSQAYPVFSACWLQWLRQGNQHPN